MLFRLVVIFSLCLVSSAFGEDPLRGRLPDGRAFRTDGGGNQIVDYIAELELTVEQLNRRVHGLEDEVSEKQELLTRLSHGDTPAPLRERTIETSAKNEPVAVVQVQACPALRECPEPVAIECPERAQATQCRNDLQKAGVAVQVLSEELSQAKNNARQMASSLEVIQSKHKADLGASIDREKALQAKLEEKNQGVQTASNDRAMYVSDKRSPAEQLRISVSAELTKASNLVSQRTQLYGEYSSHGRPAVQLDMGTPLSSRGRSLDTLGRLLSNARDVPQCNLVQKEVREIVRRVNDDIALLRRLMR